MDDEIFEFCSADQIDVAQEANIFDFLEENKWVSEILGKAAMDLYNTFNYIDNNFNEQTLACVMSDIIKEYPIKGLKIELSKYIHREQFDGKTSDCLSALGCIIVGILFKN